MHSRCRGGRRSSLDRVWQEAHAFLTAVVQIGATAICPRAFILRYGVGLSPGLARTCVLYGGRLCLVLAKLTGWPFATRTGTFYHFAYTLQLRWVSLQDVCSAVRRWGAHVALGLLTQRSTRSPEVLLRSSDEYVSNFFSTGWNFQQKHFHLL